MPLNNEALLALALVTTGFGGHHENDAASFAAAQPRGARASTPAQVSPADQTMPTDLPPGAGPRGTSGQQQRYDTVGYVGISQGGDPGAIEVAHGSLPVGSYVELTALDTGRTIVALVADHETGRHLVTVSPGAAKLLGVVDGAPVRIRTVSPSLQDQSALHSGHAASPRIDAPSALLIGLRKQLPSRSSTPVPTAIRSPRGTTGPSPSGPGTSYAPPGTERPVPARPTPASPPAPKSGANYPPPMRERPAPAKPAPVKSGFVVQVGAFSARDRAQSVAQQVGGRVSAAGKFFRVQIGPFADPAGARRARDEAARHGYAGAQILHIE
jgi:rare lipoprotein A